MNNSINANATVQQALLDVQIAQREINQTNRNAAHEIDLANQKIGNIYEALTRAQDKVERQMAWVNVGIQTVQAVVSVGTATADAKADIQAENQAQAAQDQARVAQEQMADSATEGVDAAEEAADAQTELDATADAREDDVEAASQDRETSDTEDSTSDSDELSPEEKRRKERDALTGLVFKSAGLVTGAITQEAKHMAEVNGENKKTFESVEASSNAVKENFSDAKAQEREVTKAMFQVGKFFNTLG